MKIKFLFLVAFFSLQATIAQETVIDSVKLKQEKLLQEQQKAEKERIKAEEKILKEQQKVEKKLKELKQEHAKKSVSKKSPFELTNRLWESLVLASGIEEETKWADLSKTQLQNLANQLTKGTFQVNGKSTFKEEFVTAGGIDLKEINFKTMESKLHQNLYFAGEIVNIDAITGGFNFQNAWTSGFIVANSI